jgi:hypothetical protein
MFAALHVALTTMNEFFVARGVDLSGLALRCLRHGKGRLSQLATLEMRNDLLLPVTHFRGICLSGKRRHETRRMLSECGNRVTHDHPAVL